MQDDRLSAENYLNDTPPSKTKRKEAMQQLQHLGERLVDLPAERLKKVAMPDFLRDAIVEAKRMTKHEAKRRQMQYIGKLMRDVETGPIEEAIAAFDGVSAAENAHFHQLEKLRERLLDDEKVLTEIGDTYPGADLQHLRQLRRNALRELDQNKPPRAYRELFRELRALEENQNEPDDAGTADE